MKPIKIRQGSAKNILIFKEPTENNFGQGAFEFLDYFSVFDWGRFLTDPIRGKGIAMATIAREHFELLAKNGIRTHYQGMASLTKMNIALVNIAEPYKNVISGLKNYLLPIEIIFRVYTHPESSDLKKIREGKRTYQELGYEEMPEPNKKLTQVKISYSTKLEAQDRILTKEEARILSGLTVNEMEKLENLTFMVNEIITKHSENAGLIHYDGKIEVAKDLNEDFMVVDVVGTLDEDRFMINVDGNRYVDFSKQFLRNWFIDEGWKAKVDTAKERAEKENIKDWQVICSQPPKLPDKVSGLITEMYLADTEARIGEKIGEKLGIDISLLKEVAEKMDEIQKAHRAGFRNF